jgi:hypothetical protein
MNRVISGGQTGADLAGVCAAKTCGIVTGGWMPKGWINHDGPQPQYEQLFGMQEHPRSGYPSRTFANAKDSDGTIRFAGVWGSAGEKLTLKAIAQYSKPFFDVNLDDETVEEALTWVQDNKIQVLNVAGNSRKTCPGVGHFSYRYLINLFGKLGHLPVEPLPSWCK